MCWGQVVSVQRAMVEVMAERKETRAIGRLK